MFTEINTICYSVYNKIHLEAAGESTRTIKKILRYAIMIVYFSCGTAVFGSLAGDNGIPDEYFKYVLYLTIFLVGVSFKNN